MGILREMSEILDELHPRPKGSCLILGIDKRGNITRFNESLEQITGRSSDEVIDTPFSTFFSKHPHLIDRWMDVLIHSKEDKPIQDLELPLKTIAGNDITVSWTSFPVKTEDTSKVSRLNLVGTPVRQTIDQKTNSTKKITNISDSKTNSNTSKNTIKNKSPGPTDNKEMLNFIEVTDSNPVRSVTKITSETKKRKLKFTTNPKNKRAKSNLLGKKDSDYKKIKNKVKKLEKEHSYLQKKNDLLEKKLHSAEIKKADIKSFFDYQLKFLKDCTGVTKKRQEFNEMIIKMNKRKQNLDHLETDLNLQKKEFKHKIDEFSNWREKLEDIEQEIEKRRQYLIEQETYINEKYDKVLEYELTQNAECTEGIEPDTHSETNEQIGIIEEADLFDSLTVEAAVLQRGRFKKVNSLFSKMLGYEEKELVGKHLVDFVGPTGFIGVEQHYVNKLKGEDDTSFDTVILTKNEEEIPVHVEVKPGEFQGQRSEIVTFKEY